MFSPNSPIFPMTAFVSLSIELSILFSLSLMSATLSWIIVLNVVSELIFSLNSPSFSESIWSTISEIVLVSGAWE